MQSLDCARQQHAGGGEMSPQLSVKVNSPVEQDAAICAHNTSFNVSLVTWCLCCPLPHPHPHPLRSVTTLPLLLSETRLSPKAPRAAGQGLGGHAQNAELEQSSTEWANWKRGVTGLWPTEVAAASCKGFTIVRLCGSSTHNSTHLTSASATLLREPIAPIDHTINFHICETERTNSMSPQTFKNKDFLFLWQTISRTKQLNSLFLF